MANPNHMMNLRTPTSEEARAMQLKGARKKKENKEKRMVLIKAIRNILNSKMSINEATQMAADQIGYKLSSKATFGEVAVMKLFQKALKEGNYKAFIELGKMAGLHHDQTAEGLGGANNPLNVAQTTSISPETVKSISSALEDDF